MPRRDKRINTTAHRCRANVIDSTAPVLHNTQIYPCRVGKKLVGGMYNVSDIDHRSPCAAEEGGNQAQGSPRS